MPGPPPKVNARRRNVPTGARMLPAGGRPGPPPKFPISRPSKSALAVWADLWSTPQAVAWAEAGWTRVVARYARLLVAAEKLTASAALLGEVRQLEDRLGLTPIAMRRLQWYIEPSTVDPAPTDVTRLDDYRERLG